MMRLIFLLYFFLDVRYGLLVRGEEVVVVVIEKGMYYGYISTTLCCFGCLVNLGDIDGVWR